MKNLRSILILIFALSICVPGAYAQDIGGVGAQPQDKSSSFGTPIQYNMLYASAYDQLWLIDADTHAASYIGSIGLEVTDVAFHLGTLYGITFSQLIRIDPVTGAGTVIGYMGYSDVNGLTISRSGTGYATTIGGNLLKVDIWTAQASLIGPMGDGYHSDGDVAISDDDRIYAAVDRDGYWNSWLVYLDRDTGAATPIGDLGYADVWGISFRNGVLYGVTYAGHILSIDPKTAATTLLGTSTADFYGLATSGPSIIGEITSPPDNYFTGPASVPFTAYADYPGGPGIAQVEFYAYSNVEWRAYGHDKTAPYAVVWTPPVELTTQQVLLRIDVVGTDLERVNFAGGVRRMNFLQSLGNPAITENWVDNRAYLSQRSLGAQGDIMCSVASMAMVLAIEGFIDRDYQSMADKATAMYPKVLVNGDAYVYKMAKELTAQGATGMWFGPLGTDAGWGYLTNYINAGHPIILRTEHGVLTNAGHFIVAVGYQEYNDVRTVIAYDPFGMWRGKTCAELGTGCPDNYYTNAKNDPTSHVGQWVFYNFDTIFGDYIIAAAAPVCAVPKDNAAQASPPDMVSNESRILGTYSGVIYGDKVNLYMPMIRR